jgi:hypothetical protein
VGLLAQGRGLAHAHVKIRVDHHQAADLCALALGKRYDQAGRCQSSIGTVDGQQNFLEHIENAIP